jgi:hypothetical protein
MAKAKDVHEELFLYIEDIPIDCEEGVGTGTILTGEKAIGTIRINNEWYTMRDDLKPMDILFSFLDNESAKHVVYRGKRGLAAIRKASCYKDTEHLDHPLEFVKKS